jgi:hypothetical protein
LAAPPCGRNLGIPAVRRHPPHRPAVKLEAADGDHNDDLLFYRVDGAWKIVSKVFASSARQTNRRPA